MVATNLKSETMALMEKRSAMEAEMNAIIDRLCQPGGPGLSGNLTDSEVFCFLLFSAWVGFFFFFFFVVCRAKICSN
jgi:hypothetical protein